MRGDPPPTLESRDCLKVDPPPTSESSDRLWGDPLPVVPGGDAPYAVTVVEVCAPVEPSLLAAENSVRSERLRKGVSVGGDVEDAGGLRGRLELSSWSG